jgi:hypothetical protein
MYSFGYFPIHSIVPILPVAHGQRQLITNRLNHPTPGGFVRDIPPLSVVARTLGYQSPVSDNRNRSSQAEYRRSAGSNRAYG